MLEAKEKSTLRMLRSLLIRQAYNNLTEEQRTTFQGPPFSPVFVVEVANISKNSNFQRFDSKIKDDYFAMESSIQLIQRTKESIYTGEVRMG